ncbi:techylectin-5A isoform X2 [Folsomia candida]|uniref:techylectin-5A isoform X2 n=1 Tax=Folsomia candida TaxID=158441 RepID=UPI0016054FA2|nr:techylectin-5A isoform X2 [Folsomia candida]
MRLKLDTFLPKNCWEIRDQAVTEESFVQIEDNYTIFPTRDAAHPVYVSCEMEQEGGGWTVIQRRGFRNPVSFSDKTWTDYKKGFGTAGTNYWLGLDNIHALTRNRDQELWVSSIQTVHSSVNGKYSGSFEADNGMIFKRFWIEDEANLYRVHFLDGVPMGRGGEDYRYFYKINGQPFSTKDVDNTDNPDAACHKERYPFVERRHIGGWWFQNSTCEAGTNLNWEPRTPSSLQIFFPGSGNRRPDKILMRIRTATE